MTSGRLLAILGMAGMVVLVGMDSAAAWAQQDAWGGENRLAAAGESGPAERGSNWNWYGNGILVRPAPREGRSQPNYGGSPGYGERPPVYRQEAPAYGTPSPPPSYGAPMGEKSRPWAELPEYDPGQESPAYGGQRDYYPDRRYATPSPWQVPEAGGGREWQDYPPPRYYYQEGYGSREERGYPPAYYDRPEGYGDRRYAPPMEEYGGSGWDGWRTPVPYYNRGYAPW